MVLHEEFVEIGLGDVGIDDNNNGFGHSRVNGWFDNERS